jgi:teichuronic acid biosynthesis glycosyltransferase TuaC
VRVAVVAEYYPRADDPVLGVWAHRQAMAARDAGADVRVLVLHRPVPPRSALRAPSAWASALRQPLRAELDGIPVTYVPFLAPARPRSYGTWGAWAAPTLAAALRRLRARWPYDLVHAHYAAPAGDAVRRSRPGRPVVVSAHGGDVLSVAHASASGGRAVRRAFAAARLVLANSAGTAECCAALGARVTRVVRLGTDLPPAAAPHDGAPTLTTVGHLVARKRHADVLRAMWLLRDSHPDLRWEVVGDGPERSPLARLAAELGLSDRVRLRGELRPAEAVAAARAGTVFVLPSVDEAFGVAYIEAMAGGVPAIGCRGEPGPQEIAAAGGGIRLVPPADPEALAAELRTLLDERRWRRELGEAARANVAAHFTWEACGRATVAAYAEALR